MQLTWCAAGGGCLLLAAFPVSANRQRTRSKPLETLSQLQLSCWGRNHAAHSQEFSPTNSRVNQVTQTWGPFLRSSAITVLLYRLSRDVNIHGYHAGAVSSRCPQPRSRPTSHPGPGPHRDRARPSLTGSQTLPALTHPACSGREPVYRRESQGGRPKPRLPDGVNLQVHHPRLGNRNAPSHHHFRRGDQRGHREQYPVLPVPRWAPAAPD